MDEQPDKSIALSILVGLLNKSNITYAESEHAFKLLGRVILAKNNYELTNNICARLPLLYFQYNSLSVIKNLLNPNPDFQSIVEGLGTEFGRQLFLFLMELKSVYNTANIIGFASIMDDLYTITDFTFENFLDYIKKVL